MQTPQQGVDLIKRFEGLELEAYRDIAGIWTIGYGHTSDVLDAAVRQATGPIFLDVKYPHFWTVFNTVGQAPSWGSVKTDEGHAEALLREDLIKREKALNSWRIMNGVELNENQIAALISFIFNVGFAAFKRSTAAKRMIKGDMEGAADALTWWNKARVGGVLTPVTGLIRRRAAERALFLAPVGKFADGPAMLMAAHQNQHRQSGARPAAETRPWRDWLPRFLKERLS